MYSNLRTQLKFFCEDFSRYIIARYEWPECFSDLFKVFLLVFFYLYFGKSIHTCKCTSSDVKYYVVAVIIMMENVDEKKDGEVNGRTYRTNSDPGILPLF